MLKTCFLIMIIAASIGEVVAQTRYTREEGLEFRRQAEQTKEYKAMKQAADSFNTDDSKVPQEIEFLIHRQIVGGLEMDTDTLIGTMERKFAINMGMPLESYTLKYARRRKMIVNVKGGVNKNVQVTK